MNESGIRRRRRVGARRGGHVWHADHELSAGFTFQWPLARNEILDGAIARRAARRLADVDKPRVGERLPQLGGVEPDSSRVDATAVRGLGVALAAVVVHLATV